MKKVVVCFALAAIALAADDYSFDMNVLEVKNYELRGYLKSEYKHQNLQEGSTTSVSLNEALIGYTRRSNNFKITTEFSATYQNTSGDEERDLIANQAYLNYKPSFNHSFDLGKKTLAWGKGYFFNPTAFFDRSKDPTQPENQKEGYLMANYRYVKSYNGNLSNLMFDLVYLPTTESFNNDYFNKNSNNALAKLYLLYLNTDIEFSALYGDQQSEKIGLTLSKNLLANLEIHAEIAKEIDGYKSYLAGFKYVTDSELTLSLEYFYDSCGLEKSDMVPLKQAVPFLGKQYGAAKLSQKEPFGVVYSTIYAKEFFNIEDSSRQDGIGATYAFKNDIEIDLSYNVNQGGDKTEFGKKTTSDFFWFKGTWSF